MNLTCIICSDGITAASETYSTQCGHLFHYFCLIQWIERSKTCPQCRYKTNEKTIHRIYLNLANTEHNGDDITTLQNKCDNFQFQLMLKEKDVNSFKEKYSKAKYQNIALREEVAELENKSRSHESIVHALKDQIAYFKSKNKESEKLIEELSKLKTKLKQMESVELLVNGSREQMTEMLKNESDSESLVILVATLKKALLDTDRKKDNMEHKFKQLQHDITKYRRDFAVMELLNKELKQKVEAMDKRKSTTKATNIRQDYPNIVSSPETSVTECPLSSKLKPNLTYSSMSPSLEEKVVGVLHSNSPYLCVKKSNAGINIRTPNSSNIKQSSAGAKQVSIFKKSTVKFDKVRSCKPDLLYNGLGGQCKDDIVYSSPETTNVGLKRHRSDACPPATKLRKINKSANHL